MTTKSGSADTTASAKGLVEIDAEFLQQTDSMEACFKAFDKDRFAAILEHSQSNFGACIV